MSDEQPFRVVCVWRDDQERPWSHVQGPYADRRSAYTAFHDETRRRHSGLARPPSTGAHNVVITLIEDINGSSRTLERWPGELRLADPTEGAPR